MTLANKASGGRTSQRRIVPTGALASLSIVGTLAVWLLGTSTGTLREQLKWLQYWSLEGCVFVGLVLCGSVASRVRALLVRRDAMHVGGLLLLAVALVVGVAPRTNRIFYDEQIYQSVGQNLADLRLAQVCRDGDVEYGGLRCASGEYNKQPYGYPHLLSLAYRLVGTQPWVAFGVNALAAGLTAVALYLLSLLLFGDRAAALLGAVVLLLIPEQTMWSATAAVEPTASAACLAAVLSAAIYLRLGGWAAVALMATASAYAAQFRPESFLIWIVVGTVAWPRLTSTQERDRAWWAVALFLALSSLHVAHLYAVRGVGWGTEGDRFAVRFLMANLRINGGFYLFDIRFPFVFSVLALAGAATARLSRPRMAMVIYFLAFFAVYLFFYAGSYNYGADVRYSLATYPSLAVLAGLGGAASGRAFAARWPSMPVNTIGGVALGFLFLTYTPVIRGSLEEAWAARADVAFARGVAAHLPAHSYVLTHNPGMFHLWGRNAGQMSLVTANAGYLEYLQGRYPGGIYLHWNFWCNVQDAAHTDMCRRARDLRQVDVIEEHTEGDQYFAFYRLQP